MLRRHLQASVVRRLKMPARVARRAGIVSPQRSGLPVSAAVAGGSSWDRVGVVTCWTTRGATCRHYRSVGPACHRSGRCGPWCPYAMNRGRRWRSCFTAVSSQLHLVKSWHLIPIQSPAPGRRSHFPLCRRNPAGRPRDCPGCTYNNEYSGRVTTSIFPFRINNLRQTGAKTPRKPGFWAGRGAAMARVAAAGRVAGMRESGN